MLVHVVCEARIHRTVLRVLPVVSWSTVHTGSAVLRICWVGLKCYLIAVYVLL